MSHTLKGKVTYMIYRIHNLQLITEDYDLSQYLTVVDSVRSEIACYYVDRVDTPFICEALLSDYRIGVRSYGGLHIKSYKLQGALLIAASQFLHAKIHISEHRVEIYSSLEDDITAAIINNIIITAILSYQNVFTLHGSMVLCNGKGICLIGESGVGKSTLTYEIIKKHRGILLADDNILCTHDDSKITVVKSSIGVRLIPSQLDQNNLNYKGKIVVESDNNDVVFSNLDKVFFIDRNTNCSDSYVEVNKLTFEQQKMLILRNIKGTYCMDRSVTLRLLNMIDILINTADLCKVSVKNSVDAVPNIVNELLAIN